MRHATQHCARASRMLLFELHTTLNHNAIMNAGTDKDSPKRITLVGHSYAGALATVFAPWCQMQADAEPPQANSACFCAREMRSHGSCFHTDLRSLLAAGPHRRCQVCHVCSSTGRQPSVLPCLPVRQRPVCTAHVVTSDSCAVSTSSICDV